MMKYKRISAVLLCLVLIMSAWSMQVSAEESVGITEDISFTVVFRDGARSITGAKFRIYKLGELDGNAQLVLSEQFAGYPVQINSSETAELRNTALALEGYVLRDGLLPYDQCRTDENGIAAFPNEKDSIEPGVYLVLGASFVQEDKAYACSPFISVLPTYSEDGTVLNYDVTAVPKYEAYIADGEGISRKVIKVWNDDGNNSRRPDAVTVDLLCNGEVFDTVVLNAENNWRFEWSGLDESCYWTVAERETAGYTVTVSLEETVFVITNTCEPNDESDDSSEGEKLPQTGQLWWPVPVLSVVGLLCIAFGIIRRRGA